MTRMEAHRANRNIWKDVILAELLEAVEGEPDPATMALISAMRTYVCELDRKIDRTPPSKQHVKELRVALREVSDTMHKIQEHAGSALVGWSYGKPPKNNVQRLFTWCSEMLADMSSTVVGAQAHQ